LYLITDWPHNFNTVYGYGNTPVCTFLPLTFNYLPYMPYTSKNFVAGREWPKSVVEKYGNCK